MKQLPVAKLKLTTSMKFTSPNLLDLLILKVHLKLNLLSETETTEILQTF